MNKNSNLVPAVCGISCAPLDDVDAITSTPDRFHRHVGLKTGKSWEHIYFTPGTAEFTEKPKDTEAGELIEQSLKCIFPGDDDANLAAFDLISARPLLVIVQFNTGDGKIMGDLGNGAKLAQTSQFSAKGSGSQLEFSCMATYRACRVTP